MTSRSSECPHVQGPATAASSAQQESGIELAARPLRAFTDRQLAALAGHAGERRAPLTAAVAMHKMRVRAADVPRPVWRAHAAGALAKTRMHNGSKERAVVRCHERDNDVWNCPYQASVSGGQSLVARYLSQIRTPSPEL